LRATAGNGSQQQWIVQRDDGFEDDRLDLEAVYPRIARVFLVLERQFERLPSLNSRWLAGEVWLYRTRLAFGAPPLFIYYEIDEVDGVVCLLAATLAGA
jgi:hypothetical protein